MGRLCFSSVLAVGLSLLLSACGDPASDDMDDPVASEVSIAPQDFAVVPCEGTTEGAPCLVVHAGGKAALFGAPAGAMDALEGQYIAIPDVVLLPDLMPASLEGLVRLRNATWSAGRSAPLPVIGPAGTREITAHINAALVLPDAELFAVDAPPGGFEAALIAGLEAPPSSGFDTGDFRIEARPASAGMLEFHVQYGGRRLILSTCEPPASETADLIMSMTCDGASRSYDWPFDEKLYKFPPS